jgi:tetratricopeptide (TPR) repeat protein
MRLIHALCLCAVAILASAPARAETPPAAQGEVDESALRHFARTGDAKRLAAETARLKALHPDWEPPADPLADAGPGDPRLDALWRLQSEGRQAELRALIAQYEAEDPDWVTPADLLSQLALAEARTRLVNASDLGQSRTVVEVAQANPGLLTCQDLDLMWRLAAAFAQTGRADRASDAYRYVLDHCAGGPERLATLQKAGATLDRAAFDALLAHALADPEAGTEIARVRLDLARQAVGRAGPGVPVDPAEVARVEAAFAEQGLASDALLLGWADYRLARPAQAGAWFQRAREAEDSADAAIGLGLVALAGRDYAGAEAALASWRDASDDARAAYLAAASNLLAGDPPAPLDEAVLARIVPAVTAARDPAAAAQLGWYARAFGQPAVAEQWFATALAWKPEDETAAYGLALSSRDLGRTAELAALQDAWRGRSERIAAVGAVARSPGGGRAPGGGAPAAGGGGTAASGGGALASGWKLLDANRPLEAAQVFGAALASASPATREEAAYGQSLAYLRLRLVDQAAVSALKAPQSPKRAAELQATILADRAVAAFGQGRYAETLTALDQRAAVARERIDLMVLRGYANLKLNRRKEAERVFAAAAGTGNVKAAEGLALVRKLAQAGR